MERAVCIMIMSRSTYYDEIYILFKLSTKYACILRFEQQQQQQNGRKKGAVGVLTIFMICHLNIFFIERIVRREIIEIADTCSG